MTEAPSEQTDHGGPPNVTVKDLIDIYQKANHDETPKPTTQKFQKPSAQKVRLRSSTNSVGLQNNTETTPKESQTADEQPSKVSLGPRALDVVQSSSVSQGHQETKEQTGYSNPKVEEESQDQELLEFKHQHQTLETSSGSSTSPLEESDVTTDSPLRLSPLSHTAKQPPLLRKNTFSDQLFPHRSGANTLRASVANPASPPPIPSLPTMADTHRPRGNSETSFTTSFASPSTNRSISPTSFPQNSSPPSLSPSLPGLSRKGGVKSSNADALPPSSRRNTFFTLTTAAGTSDDQTPDTTPGKSGTSASASSSNANNAAEPFRSGSTGTHTDGVLKQRIASELELQLKKRLSEREKENEKEKKEKEQEQEQEKEEIVIHPLSLYIRKCDLIEMCKLSKEKASHKESRSSITSAPSTSSPSTSSSSLGTSSSSSSSSSVSASASSSSSLSSSPPPDSADWIVRELTTIDGNLCRLGQLVRQGTDTLLPQPSIKTKVKLPYNPEKYIIKEEVSGAEEKAKEKEKEHGACKMAEKKEGEKKEEQKKEEQTKEEGKKEEQKKEEGKKEGRKKEQPEEEEKKEGKMEEEKEEEQPKEEEKKEEQLKEEGKKEELEEKEPNEEKKEEEEQKEKKKEGLSASSPQLSTSPQSPPKGDLEQRDKSCISSSSASSIASSSSSNSISSISVLSSLIGPSDSKHAGSLPSIRFAQIGDHSSISAHSRPSRKQNAPLPPPPLHLSTSQQSDVLVPSSPPSSQQLPPGFDADPELQAIMPRVRHRVFGWSDTPLNIRYTPETSSEDLDSASSSGHTVKKGKITRTFDKVTCTKLVEKCTGLDASARQLWNVVMLTYRQYLAPEDLLRLLIIRYQQATWKTDVVQLPPQPGEEEEDEDTETVEGEEPGKKESEIVNGITTAISTNFDDSPSPSTLSTTPSSSSDTEESREQTSSTEIQIQPEPLGVSTPSAPSFPSTETTSSESVSAESHLSSSSPSPPSSPPPTSLSSSSSSPSRSPSSSPPPPPPDSPASDTDLTAPPSIENSDTEEKEASEEQGEVKEEGAQTSPESSGKETFSPLTPSLDISVPSSSPSAISASPPSSTSSDAAVLMYRSRSVTVESSSSPLCRPLGSASISAGNSPSLLSATLSPSSSTPALHSPTHTSTSRVTLRSQNLFVQRSHSASSSDLPQSGTNPLMGLQSRSDSFPPPRASTTALPRSSLSITSTSTTITADREEKLDQAEGGEKEEQATQNTASSSKLPNVSSSPSPMLPSNKPEVVEEAPQHVQTAVLMCLQAWVKQYPTDFISLTMRLLVKGLLLLSVTNPPDEKKALLPVYVTMISNALNSVLSAAENPSLPWKPHGAPPPVISKGLKQYLTAPSTTSLHQPLLQPIGTPQPNILPGEKAESDPAIQQVSIIPSFPPVTSPSEEYVEIPLEAFDPHEIARQMTLIEADLYMKMQMLEFVSTSWMKPNSAVFAKNVKKMTERFNRVTLWTASCIISSPTPADRAKLIEYFITVADECFKLNNFNGLVEIMLALGGFAIKRLKKSWAAVSSKRMETYRELQSMTDVAGKSANLRRLARTTNPPVITLFSTYLTDLVYAEEAKTLLANDACNDMSFINFAKHRRIYEVVLEIKRSGNVAHPIHPLQQIWPALMQLDCYAMPVIEDKSYELE